MSRPLLSIGRPLASITRPSSPSPTRTVSGRWERCTRQPARSPCVSSKGISTDASARTPTTSALIRRPERPVVLVDIAQFAPLLRRVRQLLRASRRSTQPYHRRIGPTGRAFTWSRAWSRKLKAGQDEASVGGAAGGGVVSGGQSGACLSDVVGPGGGRRVQPQTAVEVVDHLSPYVADRSTRGVKRSSRLRLD